MENKIPNLKDEVVGEDKKVKFIYLLNRQLWYRTNSGFEFPVPVEDTDGAKFLADDRAMVFMKWIRKHIVRLQEEETEKEAEALKPWPMHESKYAMLAEAVRERSANEAV